VYGYGTGTKAFMPPESYICPVTTDRVINIRRKYMTKFYRYLCVIIITTFCVSILVTAHAGDTTTLKEDAATLNENTTTSKENATTLKEDTAALKENVPTLKEEMTAPKEDATNLEEDTATLTVEDGAICKDVVDHTAVEPGTSFPAFVEKLYCYTKIVGAIDPTEITHVWFYGDTERARVTLAVNSPLWRTYSSKIIEPHEIGSWNVVVLDESENVLESFSFTIVEE
jgi:hypothetical protein